MVLRQLINGATGAHLTLGQVVEQFKDLLMAKYALLGLINLVVNFIERDEHQRVLVQVEKVNLVAKH